MLNVTGNTGGKAFPININYPDIGLISQHQDKKHPCLDKKYQGIGSNSIQLDNLYTYYSTFQLLVKIWKYLLNGILNKPIDPNSCYSFRSPM
jgi:hypothetical protein